MSVERDVYYVICYDQRWQGFNPLNVFFHPKSQGGAPTAHGPAELCDSSAGGKTQTNDL